MIIIVSDIKAKTGCQCILAISITKVSLESYYSEKLMVLEGKLGNSFDTVPLYTVCCYEVDSFSKLQLKDIIQILNYHKYSVYQGGMYLQWQLTTILALLERAIDSVIGVGTSKLLLKTLELIYHISEEDIMSQPQLFQDKLKQTLGPSSDNVVSKIKDKMTSGLMYLNKADGTNWRPDR